MTETPATADKSGWLAVFATLCIWIGFILVSRVGGRGVLTAWDVAALRFGTGGLIALCFLPRVTLPPLRIVFSFALFGGITYACFVYSAFRLAPAAHAAILLPGALPFETALLAWAWLGQKPSRRQGLALAGFSVVTAGVLLGRGRCGKSEENRCPIHSASITATPLLDRHCHPGRVMPVR